MRRRGIVAVLWLAMGATPRSSLADGPAGEDGAVAAVPSAEVAARPAQRVGYGAMPGGLHVAAAEALPRGTVEVTALSGYGYRKGLLADGHTMSRALGDFAIAYAPRPDVVLGLSLDGRYDKHTGFSAMADDGYVGDPHAMIRYAAPRGRISLGGQLGLWVPGKDAPSVAASAISVDVRALLSIDAGFGLISANAGVRLDNSRKSVDDPDQLSVEDRVSLGVSEFHAAVAGVSVRIPTGKRAYVALEGSADVFVGSGAPGPILRGGGIVGFDVTEALSIIGYVEVAKVPGIDQPVEPTTVALVPYEPAITGGLGLQARFGGGRRAAVQSQIVKNATPQVVLVAETADVTGVVVDDAGKPVVGAKVSIKLKNHTGTAVTDGKGEYTILKLPIGKTVDGKTELDDTGAELTAEVASKKPGAATLTLVKGANTVPTITLDPLLPPGQLRAVIINVGTSRPVAGATVTIEPGGITQTSGPDGKFTVDLPPGQYKLTVTARGLARQQLDVNIEQNGVAIKNIELHK